MGERIGKLIIFTIPISFLLLIFLSLGTSITSTDLRNFILLILLFTVAGIFPLAIFALPAIRNQIKLNFSNKTLSFRKLLCTTTFRNTDIATWGIRTVYYKIDDTAFTFSRSYEASFYFECTTQKGRKFIYPIPYWKRDKGVKINAQYISEDRDNFLRKFQQVIGKEPEKIENIGSPNKVSGSFFDNEFTTFKHLF